MKILLIFVTLTYSLSGMAWGRRGHDAIAKTASRLLNDDGKTFLKAHEIDLGYYSNVPDVIWRNMPGDVSKHESPQHFLDWNDSFKAIFKTPFDLPESFSEYIKKFGDKFDAKLGFSPWRISDLVSECKKRTADLNQAKQGPLLVCLGTMAHYVEDLGNPLHVTDNYDGQMTGQKGIHAHFETTLVDELDVNFYSEIQKGSRKLYSKLKKEKKPFHYWVRWLIDDSYGKLDELLRIDKSVAREPLSKSLQKNKALILDRMVSASTVLALIWGEILEPVKSWDSNKFYFFDGKPDYIEPSQWE